MNPTHVRLALAILAILASAARAEDRLPVGILNMDRVLKTHQPLLDQMKPLQAEAKKLQETVQVRQAEIETVALQLKKTEQGSPEFQRLQMQGVKLQNELRQYAATEQQALQKKELGVLVAFFRTLEEEVAKYSQANGIKLVIRQQDTTIDENQQPAEILKILNRGIIYQDGLDITDEILKALAARASDER
jgi:Skp family chaperone for outer membrane proteins